jgi:hypothetical protein
MVWSSSDTMVGDNDFIKGGQTALDWASIEPARNTWDFSQLHSELAYYASINKPTIVEVESWVKPNWIYNGTGINVVGTYTKNGNTWDIPRYWGTPFMTFMEEMLTELGNQIRNSPNRKFVQGIRSNVNFIGTEQFDLTDPQATVTDQSAWDTWTQALGIDLYVQVMRLYNTAFLPETHSYLRSVIFTGYPTSPDIETELLGKDKGWIFAIAEDPDVPKSNVDDFYIQWAKSGLTEARYEGLKSTGYTHPISWIYWRHLLDLHRGASSLATYNTDLELAYAGQPNAAEYLATYNFANFYAGYADKPTQTPGGFIAFRPGSIATQVNYSMFITLHDADGSLGGDASTVTLDSNTGATIIGPTSQRFGRYARRTAVSSGKDTFYLQLDAAFKNSLSGSPTIRITYLDSGTSSFTVKWGVAAGSQQTVTKANSGTWVQKNITISSAVSAFNGDLTAGSDLLLTATGSDTTFHMVEVLR